MLFWRSHRCARIIFSLNFHLGKWTPQQCVDFLVLFGGSGDPSRHPQDGDAVDSLDPFLVSEMEGQIVEPLKRCLFEHVGRLDEQHDDAFGRSEPLLELGIDVVFRALVGSDQTLRRRIGFDLGDLGGQQRGERQQHRKHEATPLGHQTGEPIENQFSSRHFRILGRNLPPN